MDGDSQPCVVGGLCGDSQPGVVGLRGAKVSLVWCLVWCGGWVVAGMALNREKLRI